MDIVMRALPVAYTASFGALRAELESLSTRLVRLRDAAVIDSNARDGSGSSTSE